MRLAALCHDTGRGRFANLRCKFMESTVTTTNLEESAATLLLRSPRLSVSLVLELLDISDAEFRGMVQQNTTLSALLEQRRKGELTFAEPKLKACPGCGDWFIPYAAARFCSDECHKMAVIEADRRCSSRRSAPAVRVNRVTAQSQY